MNGNHFDAAQTAAEDRAADVGEVAEGATSDATWKLVCWREKTLGSNRLQKTCVYRRTDPAGCPDCGANGDRK